MQFLSRPRKHPPRSLWFLFFFLYGFYTQCLASNQNNLCTRRQNNGTKTKTKKQRERELRSKGNIPTGNPKSWAWEKLCLISSRKWIQNENFGGEIETIRENRRKSCKWKIQVFFLSFLNFLAAPGGMCNLSSSTSDQTLSGSAEPDR